MASLRRKFRSPYFFACYLAPDGRRVQRSTKQSRRKAAQVVADQWERAARLGAQKRLGEAQARRVLAEIYEAVNGETLPSATAGDFLKKWAEDRKGDTSARTSAAYGQVAREFLASLGDRADRDISQIGKADVAKYRDGVRARTSVATANKLLKYLRVALGAAWKDGLAPDNPAAKLDTIRRGADDRGKRRPFTVKELKTILTHATGEWKGIILFGLYTGQRLKDIARLTWQNIDPEGNVLRFETGKTGRRMEIPLASPLLAHLQTMPAGDDPSAPLFSEAFAIASKEGSDSRLSQQFHGLLVSAGLASARLPNRMSKGIGRAAPRELSEISFHSLRHTATSLLKNAGVSEAVAMDIIGHDTEAMSRIYTTITETAKRKAIAKMPDVTVRED
jgi:integrase